MSAPLYIEPFQISKRVDEVFAKYRGTPSNEDSIDRVRHELTRIILEIKKREWYFPRGILVYLESMSDADIFDSIKMDYNRDTGELTAVSDILMFVKIFEHVQMTLQELVYKEK